MDRKERVVVLGASDDPERYSHRAFELLARKGHEPVPVHPKLKEIEGVRVFNRIEDVKGEVDTVTVYVGPERSASLVDSIVALKPRRIIANPGAESAAIRDASERAGIQYVEACTLVLLATGQF